MLPNLNIKIVVGSHYQYTKTDNTLSSICSLWLDLVAWSEIAGRFNLAGHPILRFTLADSCVFGLDPHHQTHLHLFASFPRPPPLLLLP